MNSRMIPGGLTGTLFTFTATIAATVLWSQPAGAIVMIEEFERANAQTDWDTALAAPPNGSEPEQGGEGWEYGYYATDATPSSFTLLDEFTGSWNPSLSGLTSPVVARNTMHPGFQGSLNQRWAVRRWTSEFTGTARITGTVNRTQSGTGDGLDLRFYLNGAELTSEAVSLAGDNNNVNPFDFTLLLTSGDELDIAADDRNSPSFDNLALTLQVFEQVAVPEPATGALMVFGLAIAARIRRRSKRCTSVAQAA